MNLYLLCQKQKHVLSAGKLLLRDDNTPFAIARKEGETKEEKQAIRDAVFRFIVDHARDGVEVLLENALWDCDLEDYEWVDNDYGLKRLGSRRVLGD